MRGHRFSPPMGSGFNGREALEGSRFSVDTPVPKNVRFSKRELLSSSMYFRHLLSALRGSRFCTWPALRFVQAATSIGRIGLKSLALKLVSEVRSGSIAEVASHVCDVR